MSRPTNCCTANNVDRNNEVYVLPESGRFAYHNWKNDLMPEEEQAPVAAAPVTRAKSQGRSKG